MSTTFGTINSVQPSWTRRAFALFKRYRDAFQNRRRRTRLRARLSDLDDRELQDIGLTRGEIDYAASCGAAGVDPRVPVPI
ncbi:MAG: DUF1127 domain-containing protein [Bradyrhizobium sp.]